MILLIDNYDSFTFNLAHLIGGLEEEVRVMRNDAITAQEALSLGAEAIVLSPGPRTPNEAGICLELVCAAADTRTPIFGVCLGMQSIAQSFGGEIVHAGKLMHGKTCGVTHEGIGLFADLPSPFTAARYHSLVADRSCIPEKLVITGRSEDDQEIMAIAHRDLPIMGVQFHPESIATEHGPKLFGNFLKIIRTQ
ncbi:aminodeoxychorismate/anthranilate synthase component II [Hyphococcus flavus]|uniref:Aminodeoxychorismate/anthranilate synthase component II n=1 Tax=Hyphococcus flavus TaxID=1866326 RepID=A0AAF0CFL4_9PROT|nr:aminodeoxychorismate/anthranilate synthase component II [Hyphococcus flavus]WDI31093.1 aminodeoxychorismate/anthranilate synthase component II [Hyphococcus flavus]